MKAVLSFIYSVIAYLIGFASILLWIASVSNLVPQISIDGERSLPLFQAIAVNIGLVLIFALHHSITARKPFKEWLTRYIPVYIERSTFVLMSGVLLTIVVLYWQPMGGLIWSVPEGTILYYSLYTLFFTGWTILFVSTFLINHFDLFGLRQTFLELQGKPYTPLKFRINAFYKYVRHPLYFGGILGLWATPHMTGTHLFFALCLTAYFVIGAMFEERDLVKEFGDVYEDYQKNTSMILPLPKKKVPQESMAAQG
jgi:protein-S-isoprenylcysteine O-methyltransferase Ste14